MTRFKVLVVFIVAMMAVLPAYAQGGPNIPAPSGTGGSFGGPSMSGAAMNMGTPSFTPPQPSLPAPGSNAPSMPSGGERPSGNGGGLPSGGERPNGSGGGLPAGGERPSGNGSGQRPDFSQMMNQFSFSGDRFGERGNANLTLGSFQPGEGQSWLNFGGFGTRSDDAQMVSAEDLQSMPWQTEGSELPTAPAAYDEIRSVVEAQQAAWQSQAQDTIEAAQQSYDQFWTDYYAAVDYTAQTYYDTVTASADYLYQTYVDAVNYTTAAVDYYIDYYDQYVAYCAAYPWDCYMYAYDAATNTYYYVGDVSDEPVATVEIGDVTIQGTYPTTLDPEPSADAYRSLVLFANDQLGAVVQPLYAGTATEEIAEVLAYLPDEIEAYALETLIVSCDAHWGILNGGAAGVATGYCDGAPQAALSSNAAGMYGLHVDAAPPTTDAEALALVTQVFPKLEGLAFATIVDVEQGSAYTATTAGLGVDPVTGEALSVPKVILTGVVTIDGQPYVYALVLVGETYVGLMD